MRDYSDDTYFLETCDALEAARIDAAFFADRHGLLLLKPDAAVTGAMKPAVIWLIEHGYRIVGAYPVQFTPLRIRALWYFNWGSATPHRRRLADRLAGISSALVVIVTHPDHDLPVSVRLTADKGTADPANRKPGQLRYVLRAGTYLLNLVHTPDNPSDMLRELSIYFAEPLLTDVITACSRDTDARGDAITLAESIEFGVERKSTDITLAQDAVWEELRALGITARPVSSEEWVMALCQADEREVVVDTWFRTVIESAYLPMHR